MVRSSLRARTRRVAAAAFLTLMAAAAACASAQSARTAEPKRDPKQWTAVSCASCTQAGVEVSLRNSLDAAGKTGRHMAAQVRNLNPHAVVLVLEIVPEQPRPADEALTTEKWRVMLQPAGAGQDASTVLFHARDVQGVAVHDVEKF
jgi:hypothetical protein